MSTIGERFRQVRKELHLTQVEMGKLIGISGAGVGKIETNVSQPTEAAIKLICSKYHVNYLWLVEGKGDMREEEDAEAMIERVMAGHSEFAISIMKAFTKLPDEEWYKLRDLIDKIKKEGLS